MRAFGRLGARPRNLDPGKSPWISGMRLLAGFLSVPELKKQCAEKEWASWSKMRQLPQVDERRTIRGGKITNGQQFGHYPKNVTLEMAATTT